MARCCWMGRDLGKRGLLAKVEVSWCDLEAGAPQFCPSGAERSQTRCRGRPGASQSSKPLVFSPSSAIHPPPQPMLLVGFLNQAGDFLCSFPGQLAAVPSVPLGALGQVLSLHGHRTLAKSCTSSLCRMEAGARAITELVVLVFGGTDHQMMANWFGHSLGLGQHHPATIS